MTRSGAAGSDPAEVIGGAAQTRDGRHQRPPQPGRLSPARALAGAAVAVGGVLLGIGSLLWVTDDPSQGPGPTVRAEQRTELVPSAPPAPVAATPVAPAPASSPASLVVPVTVLNNSHRTGLAERAAARFERGGWPVTLTGNFRGQIPVTTVYYDPGLEASARAFAGAFEGIVRVRPRFATLPARGVVVVLTREFGA